MPDYAVYTKMLVKDDVTKAFTRMSKGADKFGSRADRAFRKASKGAGLFKNIVGGILTAKAIQHGARLGAQAVRSLTDEILEFDQASSVAGAKFGIKRGSENFKKMQSRIREVGAATEYTAGQAGRGMQAMAQQGFKLDQAMGSLKTMTDLATNAEMGLAEATTISLDTLGAFGLRVDDAVQNKKNLSRVNDVLVHTINSTSTDLDQLYDTMRYGASTMKSMAGDIETLSAMLTAMANAGVKGSQAGTSLKQMFLKISSKKAQKELKKFGIEVEDGNDNMRDMFSIVKDMSSAYSKMGNVARKNSLQIVLGDRAIVGFNTILDMGAEKLEGFRTATYNAGKESVNTAIEIRKSLENRLAKLKSAAVEVGLKFFDAFGEKIPIAISKANKWISSLDVKAIIADIKGVVSAIKEVTKYTDAIGYSLQIIASAWVGLKVATMIGVIGKLTIGLAGLAKAAAVLKFAVTALGGPIGIAIGMLIFAGIEIYKHREAWAELGKFLIGFFRGIGSVISAGASMIWDLMKGLATNIKNLFTGKALIPMDFMGRILEMKNKLKDIDLLPGLSTSQTQNLAKMQNRLLETGMSVDPVLQEQYRKAPNATDVKARQQIDFRGQLNISGAPKGSVFDQDMSGAPPMSIDLLGANP